MGACVSLGAVATPVAWGALPAAGEKVAPSSENAASCPSPNPPNELTLAAGTPQTATLGSAFATSLQVTFANSNGCPLTPSVAGSAVTFSAPPAGASGLFSASGSNTVTVGSDTTGVAAAPLTANDTAGSFTVVASSAYGSVQFSLRNAQAGNPSSCDMAPAADTGLTSLAAVPAKLTTGVGTTQATRRGTRFPVRLAITVTDAEKNPVPGVLVAFAAPSRGPSGYFTVRSGGVHTVLGSHTPGSRMAHPRQVEVRTDACGIALAPVFTADHRAGGYIVVGSVEHLKVAFALVNRGS
jgi:hypothetical protein